MKRCLKIYKKKKNVTYLVTVCIYNCGFAFPEASDLSLDDISKKTVKQVFLSSPHNFQAVVFPCPIIVLETAASFCKASVSR